MRCENRSLFSIPTSSKTRTSLPVSSRSKEEDAVGGGLIRRRLSSMSFNIPGAAAAAAAASSSSLSFSCTSKSMMGNDDYAAAGVFSSSSLRKWWDWSWAWILSRKPIFASDLEMNEQETKLLGSNNKGSWRHVFCRLRSEIRKFITTHSDHYTSLPQTYRPAPHQQSSS